RERVAGALKEAAVPQRVIARILVKGRRQNGLDPVVFVYLIREGVPIVATIAGCTLVKLRIRILHLRYTCEYSDKNKSGIIEAILSGANEFFFRRLRRKLCVRRYSAEIG